MFEKLVALDSSTVGMHWLWKLLWLALGAFLVVFWIAVL